MSERSEPSAGRARRPHRIDVVAVLPLVALIVVGTANLPVDAGEHRPMDALAYACGVVGAVALMFWRHWSLPVVGVVAVTTAVYSARDYAGGPAHLPGPLALLALGYTVPRRVGWLATAGYVAVVGAARLAAGDAELAEMLILVGWASAAVLAGQAIAARAERLASERDRRAHQQEQAVANERLRIARELHDSVAHAMATINVQSGVAAHLLDRDDGQAKQALEAIRAASSDALDELTAILSVLRASPDGGPVEAAPRSPVGTLGDLGELAARARSDGLPVTLGVRGDVDRLPPSVSAAGYRVVQEALTNARRHAGPTARADVVVDASERGALSVRVRDDGGATRSPRPAAGTPAGGFGLLGMRERVESTGGTLVTGRHPEGGFEVLARWAYR